MNTPSLGTFREYPSLKKILQTLPHKVHTLLQAESDLITFVRETVDPLNIEDVRVPLDVPRGRCAGAKWKGLSLERYVIGADSGLLHILELLKDIAERTMHPLPLLMDENIHYRLMKWMYGRSMVKYSVRENMPPIVCIYGVWHAYKFLCLHLHREFFQHFVCLEQGQIEPGIMVSSIQRLPYIERAVAALWVAGGPLLSLLDKEIQNIRSYYAGVQTRKVTCQTTPGAPGLADTTWLTDLSEELCDVPYRVSSRLRFLYELRILISDYCPAVFAVGFKVRECMWNGRKLHTSSNAKEVLSWSLLLLNRLTRPNAPPMRYVQTIATALLTWSTWQDITPGIIYNEEPCEALLSKLNRAMSHRPGMCTHEQYTDVFLSLPVARTAEHHRVRVPTYVVDKFNSRLKDILTRRVNPVTCRWMPQGQRVTCEVPLTYTSSTYLRPLIRSTSKKELHDLLRTCVCTLTRGGKPLSRTISQQMEALFPERTDQETARLSLEIDSLLQTPTEQRVKRRRRLRRLDES